MDSNSKCPNCGNSKRVSGGNAAEEYCTKCGYCFTKSDDDIPFGFRPEKDDYGLGSRIGKGKDWKKIAPRSKFLPDSNTYTHLKIKNLVEKYAAKIKHNETIVNKTLELIKESRKIHKGKNADTFVVACLYIVYRRQGIPSTPASITAKTNIKIKKFADYYKKICYLLEINPIPDKAVKNIAQIASKVGLPEIIIQKAIRIISKIPDSETGSSPTGIAAAMLSLVSNGTKYSVTRRQLAQAAGMNPQTIGNSEKRLKKAFKKYKIKLS